MIIVSRYLKLQAQVCRMKHLIPINNVQAVAHNDHRPSVLEAASTKICKIKDLMPINSAQAVAHNDHCLLVFEAARTRMQDETPHAHQKCAGCRL